MTKSYEIDVYGMKRVTERHHTLAQTRDEVEFWDVTLIEIDEDGNGTEFEEYEGLTDSEAFDKVQDILRRYPDAEENDPYPY